MLRRRARFLIGLALVALPVAPCCSAHAAEVSIEGAVRGALPPQSSRPIRLTLTRGRTASGLVLDSRQRPIPGATVKLTSSRPRSPAQDKLEPDPFQAATGADGTFQIPGLPAGIFYLRIEGPELSPLPAKVISVPNGPGLLNLGTFTLVGRSRIAGWIVDPDGRPVEGAEIWIVAEESTSTSQAARQAGPAAVTRRDGGFELRDRSVGDHEKLRACLKGFLPAEFQAQGPAATEPRIVLTPSTQIAGRVLTADGDPLSGARVSASLSSGPAGSDIVLPDPPCPFDDSAVAGAEGAFTLELKGPGRYDVTALGAGHLVAELDHLLVPPEGLEGVEIRMDDGTVVFGHVSDPEGHSVAGASISLAGSRSYTQTTTDGGGDYLLEGVGPGDEHLLIEHPDYETGNEELNISAKGGRLDLMLLSHVSHFEIRGRVSDLNGAPVEGAIISSSSDKTSTGADGSFVLSVSKGSYDLLAEKEGYSPARVAGVVVKDRSLDGLQIRLGHGLTLTGRVLGVDPAAVTENAVSVLITGSTFNETLAPIDSTGRFEIPNLPMGEWDLSAQAGERKASDRFTLPAARRWWYTTSSLLPSPRSAGGSPDLEEIRSRAPASISTEAAAQAFTLRPWSTARSRSTCPMGPTPCRPRQKATPAGKRSGRSSWREPRSRTSRSSSERTSSLPAGSWGWRGATPSSNFKLRGRRPIALAAGRPIRRPGIANRVSGREIGRSPRPSCWEARRGTPRERSTFPKVQPRPRSTSTSTWETSP